MTDSTQTSSTGWFYADAELVTTTKGWDGQMWPEITGYRGHAEQPRAKPVPADLPPFFEVVALTEGSSRETEVELPEVELPEAESAALAKQPISPLSGQGGRESNASKSVSGPEDVGEAAVQRRGAARSVLLVLMVLIIVALIAGAIL